RMSVAHSNFNLGDFAPAGPGMNERGQLGNQGADVAVEYMAGGDVRDLGAVAFAKADQNALLGSDMPHRQARLAPVTLRRTADDGQSLVNMAAHVMRELVVEHSFLEFQLGRALHVLERTTAAAAVMGAWRFHAQWRGRQDLFCFGFCE